MADTQEKKVCPCCTKHTMRSEEERKKLINRLKRVEGQIRGIIGMLENDAYCNDILIQSAAVNAAVNAFNKELLASHIRNCVARDIRRGKDETIDELVATLQKLMKSKLCSDCYSIRVQQNKDLGTAKQQSSRYQVRNNKS